jgi:hypothetical protein
MKTTCLNEEHIADYIDGRLSQQERRRVEFHLSMCDRCLEYVEVSRRVLASLSINTAVLVPASATRRVIAGLDRLDGGLRDRLAGRIKAFKLQWSRYFKPTEPFSAMALEPIRGNKTRLAEDLVLLHKTFPDLETEITIEKIDPRTANLGVAVFMHESAKPPLRVSLLSKDREMASYLIDTGEALFESIPFGRYTLVFTRNGTTIGQYAFHIRETGNGSQENDG